MWHDPLVLAGGMLAAFPDLVGVIQNEMADEASVRVLDRDPAWGAYLLAREEDAWMLPPRGSISITERPNPATESLGTLSTAELLLAINEQDAAVPAAVEHCLPALATLVDEAAARMRRGGRLVYLGAGTSGRLAMLDAVECVPTFGIEPGRVVALVAGGVPALTRSVEGAEDDSAAGVEAVASLAVTGQDTVVGVSAGGEAAYVLGGLQQACSVGAASALITCNPTASTIGRWDFVIVAPVGPEVIAGSTRLKAGTAQKLILNMLSTAVMVRLGRTAGNRMVGVRPVNAKLRQRAERLTAELSGATSGQARAALESCGWDVAAAVLTLRIGNPTEARSRLAMADGDLARALQDAD
jgi:N-acetylmuramic acid 6-phosphate etherase